jgi:dTDP-4-amino-4,6-dideoxygalactose transaminase
VAPDTDVQAPPAVPFVDLRPSHEPLREDLLDDVAALLESGAFINGPQVAAFERDFAAYCGTAACAGVGSGLDALRLALIAAGLEPGAEVLAPAHTFAATLESITQAGCRPVLVDVREDDYGMDPDAAQAAVGPDTAMLMPVHLYGQLADMRRLTALADQKGLRIVEDACQAHGASRDGIRPGERSLAAAFSFYPGKNLGAIGDAGAAATNDADLAARIRALREHGQLRKYEHDFEGWTARLDTLQAAALLRKLPLLDEWNRQRAAVAAMYTEGLEGVGDLRLPAVMPDSEPVWHLYVVRTADPTALGAFLAERGIATGRHYPKPLHLEPAYAHLGYARGAFPVTERVAAEVLSLPVFPGLTDAQAQRVVEGVRQFFGAG